MQTCSEPVPHKMAIISGEFHRLARSMAIHSIWGWGLEKTPAAILGKIKFKAGYIKKLSARDENVSQ